MRSAPPFAKVMSPTPNPPTEVVKSLKNAPLGENFFTYEFPIFICSEYNDFYVAMMTPKPVTLIDGNIAFDQQNNPISVNNSLLQVCTPQNAGGSWGTRTAMSRAALMRPKAFTEGNEGNEGGRLCL